ncbi:MAG: hypothetical protein ACFFDF_10095 [Candidatus Odinarchaeota archaeon]
MKTRKRIFSIFTLFFLLLNLFSVIPRIVVSIAPIPNQFIGEIFPNSTIPLQLSHTNTIITFNATDFPNKLGIQFDVNYSIRNLENTSIISVILPFSFSSNLSMFMLDVYENNTEISYDLFKIYPWNNNITEISVYLPVVDSNPTTLIRTNITILKNSTSVIRYHFSGSIINPLDSRSIFYFAYCLGISQNWIGNTTGGIEFRVYGKEPGFLTSGGPLYPLFPQYIDINGGKSFSYEWNNIEIFMMDVGVAYYRGISPFDTLIEFLIYFIPICIVITLSIIIFMILKKKRKKLKYM